MGFANVQQQHQLKLASSQTNGKLAAIKTQASLENSLTNSTLKHVTAQTLATTAAATQNKKVTNVCIVRPQLQQQQQQHVINSCSSLDGELKSISPPPLYTPTPSLWQTPLLLEGPQPVQHVSVQAPAPALPPTSPSAHLTSSPVGIVGGNISLSMSTTPTAMAKVAPIVVHTSPLQTVSASGAPLASCLPPSKFHNHTLAHHLQKVECLKKPKKSVQPMAAPLPQPSTSPQFCEDLKGGRSPAKSCLETQVVDNGKQTSGKHSESEELNEIPVNVIFRMALMPPQQPQNNYQNGGKSKKQNYTKFSSAAAISANKTVSSTPSKTPQVKSNGNRKVSPSTTTTTAATTSPASRINHVQQINASSRHPSSLNKQPSSKSKLPPMTSMQPNGDCNEIDDLKPHQNFTPSLPPHPHPHPPPSGIKEKEEKSSTKSKTSSTKSMSSNNTRKSNITKNVSRTQTSSSLSHPCDYTNDTFTNVCSSSTKGAVAIFRMSHHGQLDDISHLATTSLPYCLQNYWFNTYEFRKTMSDRKILNRSALREERIASYKQQLRRQAMQLLSTRSLQKLPLYAARRRLVCVDRLLKKYYKQNEKG